MSIPTVQTYLAEKLMDSLNDDFKTNIQVEKVDLSLLGMVGLKGVKILDHHNDTLIYVDKLSTSILNFKKITEKKLNLDDVMITDAKVCMKIYKDEVNDNMSVFIQKFNEQPIDTLNPFILKTKNIYINNLEYTYFNQNHLNSLLFSASSVGGCVQDFSLNGSKMNMKVRGVYFVDNRGVEVKNFTSDFLYTKEKMKFSNTTLATSNYSKVQGDIIFTYKIQDFSDFLNKVKLKASLNGLIDAKDLKKFYSGFGGNDKFKFTGNLSGKLNDLRFPDFKMLSNSGIKAKGNFRFRNSFSNRTNFRFEGVFEKAVSNYSQLNKLLPKLVGKKHKKNLDKLGNFSFSGLIDLTPDHMDAVLNLSTDLGGTITNLRLRDISDLKNAKYGGKIQFRDLDLGKLTNNPIFGKVTLKFNVDGDGFLMKDLNSILKGHIEKLEFNGYTYKNLDVNGELDGQKFDGVLKVDDENAQFVFEGLADLSSKINVFDFKADVTKLDLKKTNLFTRDSVSVVKGKIKLDAEGNTFDNIVGKAVFEDFTYVNQNEIYNFKRFDFDSEVNDSIRTINVNSDEIIQGKLEGKFLFKELIPIMQNALWSTYSKYKPVKVKPNQFLDFDFTIYSQVLGVVFPNVEVEKEARIKGNIDANNNSVRIFGESSKITAYDVVVDSLKLRIDNKNFLYHTHLEAEKVSNKYYQISNLDMVNRTKNDTLYFKSIFKGGRKETENYNLDFFYTYTPAKKSVIGIQKSFFNIKGKDWVVNPKNDNNNKLSYESATKKFEFFPFLATLEGQKMEFIGNITGKTKELKASFTDIQLNDVVPDIEKLTLEGTLNGELSLVEKKGIILPVGDVEIKDLIVNDISQGTLNAKVKGNNSYDNYDVDFSIRDYEFDNVKVVGNLDFSKKRPTMDLNVNLKKYELDGFSKFGGSVISNIRGLLSGNFKATGPIKNPNFDGGLSFESTGLEFPYLNVDYDFVQNTNVELKKQSFILKNIILEDTKHLTPGILSGSISHRNFIDWYLDLEISSTNLLVLDTRESEQEPYYGTGFLDGRATIKGKTSNLTIAVSGKTEKGTRFVIPLSDVTMADNYKLIKFKKEIVEGQPVKKEKGYRGLNFLMDLEVTKDAVAQVVIDKVNKSDLEGRGTGDLFISISNGNFKMEGDLIIDSGVYNFRYTGIPKKFEVQKGGTISWNGDPLKADLDLVAIYKARANPAHLLDNIVSNRKIPVDLYTKITGELFDSKQDFDMKIPSADSSITSELEFRFENDANSKMLNFASLLLGNTFYNDDSSGNFASNIATSTASDIFSSIFSNIINSDEGILQLNVGYAQADRNDIEESVYNDQVDLSVEGRLSDRVIFNGKVGVPVGASNIQSSVVGEAKLEVLLNETGTFRWNVFNKPNDIQYSIDEEGYTQGTGLSYQLNFSTLKEFLEGLRLNKGNVKSKDSSKYTKVHKVVKGDSLYSIAKKYCVSVSDLKEWNDLEDNHIEVGKVLILN